MGNEISKRKNKIDSWLKKMRRPGFKWYNQNTRITTQDMGITKQWSFFYNPFGEYVGRAQGTHREDSSSAATLMKSGCGSWSSRKLERHNSSMRLVASDMDGRLSGYWAAQSTASCKSWTISSSTLWYLRSSRSKTSEVHSSRTMDCTHLGRSTP